jgi:hypothetical protein
MTIFDNQTPPAPFNPRPPNLSTTNPATFRLSWSAGLGEGIEYAVNGGFETGDLTGWAVPATNSPFLVDNGTYSPPSSDGPTPPFAGQFSALASQTAPAVSCIYQTFALPPGAGILTLSWVNRVRNFSSTFATNQQFRVEIRDTNDTVLAVPYCTLPGDLLLDPAWTTNSADLSAFNGQTIRVAFVVVNALGYLDVHLDQVSLRCSTLAPPTFDVYYGTNPVPGGAQFQGGTANKFWNLAQSPPPYTNIYWQIVARRTNQTAGPIWQFSTLPSLSIAPVLVVESNSGTANAVFTVSLSTR